MMLKLRIGESGLIYCIDFRIVSIFSFNSGMSFLMISQTKLESIPKYSGALK